MGYYIRFTLEIVETDNNNVDFEEEISKTLSFNPFSDEYKWYDHHKDMVEFSKLYPNTLFKVIGEGEESGDLWNNYYRNGKSQRCVAKVVYPEFDENLLQ